MSEQLKEWPTDTITRWPIDAVKPYPRNPRTHSDEQIRLLAQSINQYGFTAPLLVDEDGVLIYGHGRHLAAQFLGLSNVPVCIARGWTDAEKSAYRIADNQLNQLSGWDMPMLKAELQDLSIDGSIELDSLGFPELQLGKLGVGPKPTADPEDTPEPPAEPVARPGDLWVLGDHLLLCGDSTNAEDVARLAAATSGEPHLMVTDPPYGVDYDPSWRATAGVNKNKKKMGKVQSDDRADWGAAWALFPGSIAYVWHGGLHSATVQRSLEGAGFAIRSQIIWVKDRFALSRGDYHWQHEPCWYAVRGKGNWTGDRSQATTWQIKAREDGGHGHGTQKPVECMLRPIQNNSAKGDLVYEPFAGSGTTIIACEMTGRRCLAIEIEPRYVDVAIARWEKFTGKQACTQLINEKKTPRRSKGSS